MRLPLPEEQVRFWVESKQCAYAFDTCYVSNMDEKDIIESKTYLSKWLGDTSFIQIVNFPEDRIDEQIYITQFYDQNFTLKADSQKRTLRGRYLRIIFAYELEEQLKCIEDYVVHATNYLRLRYGLGAALECARAMNWNLRKRDISITSANNKHITTHGDGRTENSFFENGNQSGVNSIDISLLKPDASILLDEALKNHNPHHCFLLLWMTLEAQIGQGKERKRFCEQELDSYKLSEEMKRLHDIRSRLTHSLDKVTKQELSVNRILEFIRISTLPDCPQRKELVAIVEAQINLSEGNEC